MTIQEVEVRVGIKKANIRYYEEAGLLHPKRNASNRYRDYCEEDVRLLENIKFLRSLGVSVQNIKRMQQGEVSLATLMQQRREELQREQEQMQTIQALCSRILDSGMTFATLQPVAVEQNGLWKQKEDGVLRSDRLQKLRECRKYDETLTILLEIIGWFFLFTSVFLRVHLGRRVPVWLVVSGLLLVAAVWIVRHWLAKRMNELER